MKKLFIVSLALMGVITGFAQKENLQTRNVNGFHGVEVSGGIDLYLSNGPDAVAVSATSTTVRDHMVTEVVGGVLRIHLEDNWSPGIGRSKMSAHVSIAKLDQLGASGGGDIVLENPINAGDLRISLSGGSDLKGKLNASYLKINQSGGSDVDISGNVKKLDVEASGGSDLAGYGLISDYVNISSSGGSDAQFTVNKELNVFTSGGSDVSYKGMASVKSIKSSGSSTVTHKD